MDEETKKFISFIVGRDIKSVKELTPVEIEALLNSHRVQTENYRELKATVREYVSEVQSSREAMLGLIS